MEGSRVAVGRRWAQVAWSMWAGAAYDLLFAAAILLCDRRAAGWLGIDLPADPTYLHLNGILLILVAALYALAGLWPVRYQGVVAVAAGGRFLGFLFLVGRWWAGAPTAFAALALGDMGFSVLHACLLVRARSGGPSSQVHETAST